MVNITIRKLPEGTKESLRNLAAHAGISLEAYARQVLQQASQASAASPVNLLELSQRHFGKDNGVGLELPARGSRREPVDFDS